MWLPGRLDRGGNEQALYTTTFHTDRRDEKARIATIAGLIWLVGKENGDDEERQLRDNTICFDPGKNHQLGERRGGLGELKRGLTTEPR